MLNNQQNNKKVNISDIAHIATLSEDEIAEAENSAEDMEDGEEVSNYGVPGTNESAAAEKKRLEHTEPVYRIAARPDHKGMFDFMMYHSYCNVLGIISVLLGLAAIAMVVISVVREAGALEIVMFAVVAAMFLANSPLTLWFRAKKQAATISDEANVITYTFSEVGFDMSRGENEYADFKWSDMYKVTEGKSGMYMYLERNRAFLLPKKDIDNLDGFKKLLTAHVEKRLKLRGEEQ